MAANLFGQVTFMSQERIHYTCYSVMAALIISMKTKLQLMQNMDGLLRIIEMLDHFIPALNRILIVFLPS